MQGLVVLIMLFFSILATVLIMLMAGMAMIALLFIFSVVAVIVGAQQQSVFKGLKILIYASSLTIITPLTYLTVKNYGSHFFNITQNYIQPVAIVAGLILGVVFALLSYKTFEKITKLIYNKLNKKNEKVH